MTKSEKKAQEKDLVITGVIRMHPKGFGFVVPETSDLVTQDVFIPKPFTGLAVDGDRVQVEVASVVSNKGPEGKVIAILERSRTHVAGMIYEIEEETVALAYVPLLGEKTVVVVRGEEVLGLQPGDRVVLQVVSWEEEEIEAVLSHKLGSIFDPSIDVKAALEEYDIPSDFPQEVLDEAKRFGQNVPPCTKERIDLRSLETLTIDPTTAKDFDDALSLEELDETVKLYVHIADVTHYVQKGSRLDQEAQHRSNSTYFPGQCIPMLPESLSNGLCSLQPNVDRLAVTVEMEFDTTGELLAHKIYRSMICSDQRLTYEDAYKILQEKRGAFFPLLEKMRQLCLRLKKKRKERGSVEFALPETVVMVDEEGVPQGLQVVAYDITHQMVEEFMLKANETVARYLSEKKLHLTYRVHEAPDAENLKEFARLATSLGFSLKESATPEEVQLLFEELEGSPLYSLFVTQYIRSMKLAHYSPDNLGHFGLSLSHYCHFTSPIRRYADLVVHRILLEGAVDKESLQKISKHASDRERLSAKAEQNVKLLKKLRLLVQIMEKEPKTTFEARITKIKPFGIVFSLLGYEIEGFTPLSDLSWDYFVFDPKKASLKGRQSGDQFTLGQQVFVYPKVIDLVLLETKWDLLLSSKQKKKQTKKKRKKR